MSARSLQWVSDVLSREHGGLVADVTGAERSRGWAGGTIDTRAECSNRIFFALRGENVDGHRYAREAVTRGSSAVVIEDPDLSQSLASDGVPHFLVENVLRALQLIAREHRRGIAPRVVALTGSGGKTTTKEYIRTILSKRYRVHATSGNYNNMIGVPLTVLDADPEDEVLVCEVGANQVGEIEFLADIVDAHVALITNIGDAHIGYFGSRDNIALAKSELVAGLPDTAVAILPCDDDYFDYLNERTNADVKSFGTHPGADYKLSSCRATDDGLLFNVGVHSISLPAFGVYNAMNACAAFAVGDTLGVEADVMRAALREAPPLRGRGALHRSAGVLLIDESYNSSPASLKASLSELGAMDAERRIAVLGDMAELGEFAREKHRSVGEHINSLPIDVVYWVGENGGWVEEAMASVRFEEVDAEAVTKALNDLRGGDVVLVKGSRVCRLDRVVDQLIANTEE